MKNKPMENNNTPDVAYLGFINHSLPKGKINRIATWAKSKCPKNMDYMNINTELFFDCSGTRYGFKIKELKK